MNPSCNLFLVGATGAGKTSIGRQLSAHFGLNFIDLDQEIERHTGVSVSTVFDIEGEAGFRKRESALLDTHSNERGVVLATGAGAVLDVANRKHLSERGFVIWLQTTVPVQLQRLARDHSRPLLADTDREHKLESMETIRTPFYREIADLVLPNEGAHEGVPLAAERCIALLHRHWNSQAA